MREPGPSTTKNPRRWRKILSLLIYVCYLLIFLEIASRLLLNNQKFFEKVKYTAYPPDSIWRIIWIKNHGRRYDPQKDFSYAKHDPLRGWVLKPGLVNQAEFAGKFLNTNSKGVRDAREFSYERVPGKKRILIFGDSFTFGTQVSDNETYAAYLQQLLPHAEVINLGVFGYGHDQMLLHLREEGVKYKPDFVILGYLDLDKERNMMAFRDFAKSYFTLNNGQLVLQNTPVPPPEKIFQREFFTPKFLDLIKIVHRAIMVKNGQYLKQEQEITDAILKEFAKTAASINAVPVFVYLEGIRETFKQFEMSEKDKAFFTQWAREGVVPIYILPYLNAANSALLKSMGAENKVLFYKREYGHFSPRENSIIAYGIYDSLLRSGLIEKPAAPPPGIANE